MSAIVPQDEYFVAIVEAASEALVREAYARAGPRFERLSVAISVGPEREAGHQARTKLASSR